MNDYVVVTTVSTFRHRYVMHKDDLCKLNTQILPSDQELLTWAMDTVTCEECDEFSQLHLGEQIVDTVEMSEDEVLHLFDGDNDYLKGWNSDYKLQWIRRTLNKDIPFEPYHDYISRMYREGEKENEQDESDSG